MKPADPAKAIRILLRVLLVLCGLSACGRVSAPDNAYVLRGQAARHDEQVRACKPDPRQDRTRISLQPPAGGWPGVPQAVVVMNVFSGEVEIRHGDRDRCGVLQDARTLDSRFLSGMGTVLVPPKGDQRPIEVTYDPVQTPLWRPLVRLGKPAPTQRRDTFRFSLRVASVAVMLSMVLSALLSFISTRERAFLSYAVCATLFAIWMALMSGLWAYPRPWFSLGDASLRVMMALASTMIGLTVRMLADRAAPRTLATSARKVSTAVMLVAFAIAGMVLVMPAAWLAVVSIASELGFYALCLILTVLAVLATWRGERGGVAALSCTPPFLAMGLMEAVMPLTLAPWKVEGMMLSGCWLALTVSMALTLRMGSLRRQRDEMRVLAETDALTGLPNRRSALDQLAAFNAQAGRSGKPVAICFLDIDHFKRINDAHGHEVGDQVLRLFARTLLGTFRDADYVARMGGEEFLVMMPGASPEMARQRLDTLRRQLDMIPQELQLPDLRVTFSAGVTGLEAGDVETSHVLQRADAAMYTAKRSGRDRTEVSPAQASDASPG